MLSSSGLQLEVLCCGQSCVIGLVVVLFRLVFPAPSDVFASAAVAVDLMHHSAPSELVLDVVVLLRRVFYYLSKVTHLLVGFVIGDAF